MAKSSVLDRAISLFYDDEFSTRVKLNDEWANSELFRDYCENLEQNYWDTVEQSDYWD